MALPHLLRNFQPRFLPATHSPSPNLCPIPFYFSNLSPASILPPWATLLCTFPKCQAFLPIPNINLDCFCSSINVLKVTLLSLFFIFSNPRVNQCPMQCVYFPFQLSGTSYKLQSSLPYPVSVSILGNMHYIGNIDFKKKKKEEKKKGEPRRKKMQTPRATLLSKKAFVQSPPLNAHA